MENAGRMVYSVPEIVDIYSVDESGVCHAMSTSY